MRGILVGAAAAMAALLALPGAAGAGATGTPVPDRYVVVLEDSARGVTVAREHARTLGLSVSHTYDHALHGYAATIPDAALPLVKSDPRVARVVQDRYAVAIEAQTLPTGVDRVNADLGPQASGDGAGTAPGDVAVMDTGIQTTHPDLNVAGGVNCLGTMTGHDGTYGDENGHGTHVAGIVGARDDDAGTVGVAPGVRLWSVRTLNMAGGGYASTQLCGIDWVTANAPGLGIEVVNSSQALIGPADAGNCGQNNGDPLHQAICNSTAAGTLWVFAAGNSQASLGLGGGSSFDEVLAVTAAADDNGQPNVGSTATFTCPVLNGTRKSPNAAPETDDRYAGFSNWAVNGDIAHTIAAPGTCIWSTWKGGAYGKLSGTSMAAPHAAGVAHLCVAAGQCPGTPAETIQKLRTDAESHALANPDSGFTGDPLRPVPDRFYGYMLRGDLY